MEVGRVAEAAAIMDRLVVEEPLSPAFRYRHAYQLWARGRLAEADRVADQSLQLWPRHPAVWLARFWIFAGSGRAAAAQMMLANDGRADPVVAPPLATLLQSSTRALMTRHREDIAAAAAANVAAARASPFGVVNATLTLPVLGAVEAALAINRGYLVRTGPVIGPVSRPAGQPAFNQQARRKTMALWMPPAAALRAAPGFTELCRDAGFAAYWREAGHAPDFMRDRAAG